MPKSPDYSDFLGETEEVTGNGGGDFAPTHDFDEEPVLVGTYRGSRSVSTRNGERLIHNFTTPDGSPVDAWGTAILNSRLEKVAEGARVMVTSTGKLLATKNGRKAKEFTVIVGKGGRKADA